MRKSLCEDILRAIAKFVALVFASTWMSWAWVLHASGPRGPSALSRGPAVLALGGPVFLLGVFAPGLVAVGLTASEGGRHAVGALLGRIGYWKVGARFYAFALLLMPLTKLAVAVLHRLLTGSWPPFGETRPVVLLIVTVLSIIGQAGEEVGWRGYLLPRLAERTGLAAASLIVGAIWAVWHLPLFFAPAADTYGQSFPLYAAQVTAYSIALAWLYWRTGGSLLLTMIMHAAFNNTKDLVPSGGVPAGDVFTLQATLVFRLTVLVLWIVGIVLLLRMRGSGHGGPLPAVDASRR